MTGSVVAVVRDLLFASRIEEACRAAQRDFRRVDTPADLPAPDDVALALVAWDERRPDWPDALHAWSARGSRPPRIVLFGPHTDLAAHADARATDLGPMRARSRLLTELPALLEWRE